MCDCTIIAFLASTNKKSLGGASDDLLPKGVALSDFRPSNSAEIAIKVQ